MVASNNKNNEAAISSSRHGKHFFIAYDKKDEALVINDILKYNSNFLILEANYIPLFEDKNSFCFNYRAIDLRLLFSDYEIINIYYAKNKKSSLNYTNTNYIYFCTLPSIRNIIKQNDIKAYNFQLGKMMLESISPYCVFDEELILNDTLFLKLTSKALINISKRKSRKFLFALGGIGDFFMKFSIINEYLNNSKYKDIYIVNISTGRKANFDYMVKLCFGSKIKLLNCYQLNRYFFDYWLKQHQEAFLLYKKVANAFYLSKHEAQHMAFLYKNALLGARNLDYYKYNDSFKAQILKQASDEEKNYINSLVKANSINIGLQYFTEFSLGGRKWDEKNVKEFVKKCRANNINLISLNSEAPAPSLRAFCTKRLSIAGYALLISRMDLIIGVDSSAGHIAAFYSIPSITLWGQGSPLTLDYYNNSYIGFRALRKNYSIISRNKQLASVSCNTVFSLVQRFIKNELVFSDKIITYQDSVNGYNMIYV